MATASPAPASPSSSPRLPSPPPFPEVQIGSHSPTPGVSPETATPDAGSEQGEDTGATRRVRPGTKAADMASGPPLIPLSELDSPFQLQEYLLASFLRETWNPAAETSIPITRASATKLATPPENVDRLLWLYELCRLLVQRANSLIVGFFSDNPPCSAAACPEMRASEWQYLCAVHDPPKSCCAIDYCCHTLDWAAMVLTSMQHFPSRLSLGNAPGGNQAGLRQLTNIFRRVYRMFAHAWFQHRDVFWQLENHEGLYIFYKTVCDVYSLIPEENYTVPAEAEGIALEEPPTAKEEEPREPPKFERQTSLVEKLATPDTMQPDAKAEDKTTLSTGATTRRHKQNPSTGSFVTTIQEGDEDSDDKKEGLAPPAATFVSTVRRDPSSSPPKQPAPIAVPIAAPIVNIPDIEVKLEEKVGENYGNSEKSGDLPSSEAESAEVERSDEPNDVAGVGSGASTESVTESKVEGEDADGKPEVVQAGNTSATVP